MMSTLYPLRGAVQHYAWGGFQYLPQLLNISNPENRPFAEWWMGDHPGAPSRLWIDGQWSSLVELIRKDPQRWLGEKAITRFGYRLPFLFKILDVRSMLSIQAHPSKAGAEEGFRQENELHIPLNAPQRNYKDDNHKPEMMVALTDFWLLHGFRTPDDIKSILKARPELNPLLEVFKSNDLRQLYQFAMEMPADQAEAILRPLEARLKNLAGKLHKDNPDYWASLAFETYPYNNGYDRGIFSIYLLNLIHLHPGEGIFQGAGVPHAYLEGVNVELMANSDNVLRGGLTSKHIDVQELLKHIIFKPVHPKVLRGVTQRQGYTIYPTPEVSDFELSKITLNPNEKYEGKKPQGPAIGIIMDGNIGTPAGEMDTGQCFFVPANVSFDLQAGSRGATVYCAGLPEFA